MKDDGVPDPVERLADTDGRQPMILRASRWASLAALALLFSCVSSDRYSAASNEIENQDEVIRKLGEQSDSMRRERDEAKRQLELVQIEIDRLRGQAGSAGELGSLKTQLASARARVDQLESNLQRSMNEANAAGTGLDDAVTVRRTAEGVALSVEGAVLFTSGSDQVSDRGRAILSQIADRLASLPNMIRVDGHTDNQPLRVQAKRYPRGNLELSGARALNVADYLVQQGGLPRDRVSFAAFGPERPVADNSSDEGRAQNRRVEIVVLN